MLKQRIINSVMKKLNKTKELKDLEEKVKLQLEKDDFWGEKELPKNKTKELKDLEKKVKLQLEKDDFWEEELKELPKDKRKRKIDDLLSDLKLAPSKQTK